MATIKRDIFRRGVRMTHRFEEAVNAGDPFNPGTFEMPWPKRPDALSEQAPGRPCEVQRDGEHMYREGSSPVCKPNGSAASLNGPTPDLPQIFGMPVPVGTKRRLGPLKTDK
jgi:hypothetical protein